MNDFEKACRYLCLEKAKTDEIIKARYFDIETMIHGDTNLIKEYSKKYDLLIDILNS